MMSWSIGEIAALAVKAARGAGMEWGMAQEAGHALAWLERNGVSAVLPMASYLQHIAKAETYDPQKCPLQMGCLVSDTNTIQAAEGIEVQAPLLLMPFIAQCLEQETICITWKNSEVLVSPAGILTSGTEVNALSPNNLHVEIVEKAFTPLPHKTRVNTGANEAIDMLNALAHKTYAPATEASRLSGAGAGLNDND